MEKTGLFPQGSYISRNRKVRFEDEIIEWQKKVNGRGRGHHPTRRNPEISETRAYSGPPVSGGLFLFQPTSHKCLICVGFLRFRRLNFSLDVRTTRLRRPQMRRSSTGTPRVHRIPRHARDDRETPLSPARNGRVKTRIQKKAKSDYFYVHILNERSD
jgi:hypothetical protein